MEKIAISDIDFSLDYEGYYWYSDQQIPTMLSGKINKEIFTDLPFVIEANFYAASEEISINVKNIDGEYMIYKAVLKELPDNQVNEERYVAHDLDGVSKIKMLHFWKPGPPDELLEGMTTLIPAWQAFKGFIK